MIADFAEYGTVICLVLQTKGHSCGLEALPVLAETTRGRGLGGLMGGPWTEGVGRASELISSFKDAVYQDTM